MSAYIKSQIENVKYNISCFEDECDSLHYEVYVCHRERRLLEYKLTLKELDNQYVELQRLERKYKIELGKERYKRAHEELEKAIETLTSQVQRLVHLENAKKVKGDEIEMESEHVEDTNREDPIEEIQQVGGIKVVDEDQADETKPCFQIVEKHRVVGDFVEVDHIEFIIPEYSVAPP